MLFFFFLLLLFLETAQLTQLVCCAWNAFLEAFTESTDTGLVILQDNDIVMSDFVCVCEMVSSLRMCTVFPNAE